MNDKIDNWLTNDLLDMARPVDPVYPSDHPAYVDSIERKKQLLEKPRHLMLGGHTPGATPQSYEGREDKTNIELNALKLVSDFYTANHLWFWSGQGANAYGYTPSANTFLIPGRIQELIDTETKGIVLKLGFCLVDAMDRAIRKELTHAKPRNHTLEAELKESKQENLITLLPEQWTGTRALSVTGKEWLNLFSTPERAISFNPENATLTESKKILSDPRWHTQYGGSLWVKACEELEKLKLTLAKKDIKDIIVVIDNIFDMQHNTDLLLNKTEFNLVNKAYLDLRAQSKTITPIVTYGSTKGRALYKKCARYLGLEELPITQAEDLVFIEGRSYADKPGMLYTRKDNVREWILENIKSNPKTHPDEVFHLGIMKKGSRKKLLQTAEGRLLYRPAVLLGLRGGVISSPKGAPESLGAAQYEVNELDTDLRVSLLRDPEFQRQSGCTSQERMTEICSKDADLDLFGMLYEKDEGVTRRFTCKLQEAREKRQERKLKQPTPIHNDRDLA